MIHQPLPNKHGGSVEIVNYLCNERVKEKTAKILRGNPKLTKKIINSIGFKQKVAAGVLSFEELDICNDTKNIIMNSFENTLLPRMQGRYNILWVEHTDKNRLELNYVIPKIDLISQKSLTPYFDKIDRYRIEIWRDNQNILHTLSDPNDPTKLQNINNDKRIKLFYDYKKLDETIHQLIGNNIIRSRKQMISLLNKNNIQTKVYKSCIYVKLPNSKKSIRLKGDIYDEQFRDIGAISKICDRRRDAISEYNNRDTQRIFKENREQLNQYTQRKEEYFRKRFTNNRNTTHENLTEEYKKYRRRYQKEIIEKSKSESDSHIVNYFYNDDYRINTINTSCVTFNQKGKENNDSYRTTIIRIRREREFKQNALYAIRVQRKAIYKQLIENYKNIRREHNQDKRGLPTSHFSFNFGITDAYEKCRNYSRERGAILEAIERITATIEYIRKGNEFNQYKIAELDAKQIKHTLGNITKKIEVQEKQLESTALDFIKKYLF